MDKVSLPLSRVKDYDLGEISLLEIKDRGELGFS
jgi:hypothetical protein